MVVINQKLFLVESDGATLVMARLSAANIQISTLVTYGIEPECHIMSTRRGRRFRLWQNRPAKKIRCTFQASKYIRYGRNTTLRFIDSHSEYVYVYVVRDAL